MCGSLLSKFKNSNNQVDPAIHIFPVRRCSSQMSYVHQDSACYEDRGFWKDGNENYESSSDVLGTFSSESSSFSESDFSSQNEIEAAVRVLDESVSSFNKQQEGKASCYGNLHQRRENAHEYCA